MIADLRGVLLDLDGTLLDHRGAADRAVVAWARQLGLSDDPDPVARWRRAESQHYPQFERGECSFQEQRRRRVRAFSSALAGVDDERADALFDDYAAHYRQNWQALPGAAELIDRAFANGCRVGVLTNGDETQQREKLAAIGLLTPDLQVFASSTLGFAKPDARAFELACQGLATAPSQTVMVGDDPVKDILGARAAGLHAIQLCQDETSPAEGVVRSLWEAADLLFGDDYRQG
ncbi:MAG: HAD family hydrolase [Micropruina sp.]|uniref:HAD family hydrolase n=1 Tax=Micropruina sp. TaxID=2737536 RepID=UPI0039E6BB95